MSAPVDVLAVMDALELQTRQRGGSPSCETIAAARAAMAELIQALRLSDEWIREASHQTGMRATATLDRNRAILDRVGGSA